MKRLSEEEIINELRTGNKDVLVYLYDRFYKPAVNYVLKHGGVEADADTLLKDALELLWDNYHFRTAKHDETVTSKMNELFNQAWAAGDAKRYISRNTRIKPYYLRMSNRKIAAIVVLILISVTIPLAWWYIESYLSVDKTVSGHLDEEKNAEKDKSTAKTGKYYSNKAGSSNKGRKNEADTATNREDSLRLAENGQNDEGDEKKINQDESQQSASPDQIGRDDEIVIKKDKMFFVKNFSIIEKQHSSESNESTKDVVGKLNPDAKLPEETTQKNILIEFWKSPVNYNGYKFSKNKIVLFGIEEPEIIKVLNINDNYYLEYGQTYFALDYSNDFRSFSKVRDPVILAQLEKK